MNATVLPTDTNALLARLREAVGAANVIDDAAELAFLATDVFRVGTPPQAAVRPRSVVALQAAVRVCDAANVAMVPRGGGVSYTDAYLFAPGGHVLFDLVGLDSIEIDAANALVSVGAGVTWAALRERLVVEGFRTPFWGPFSGLVASIGGSVSQNAISHGSGAYGISAQSVHSMDVVLANGELLHTGVSAGSRHFGPDLTGLFTGDCGALGFKATLRLPLIKVRPAFAAVSFAFDDFASFHQAVSSAAREGLDDEHFGLDVALSQGQIAKQEGLNSRLRIALGVFKTAANPWAGFKQLLKMGLAGDQVLESGAYMCHFITEGASAAEANAKARALRALLTGIGREIPNSVPTFVRAFPFAPLNNTLGPHGERWVPLHGVLPHASVAGFHDDLKAFYAQRKADMDRLGVWTGAMFCAVGSTGLLYEIALYWPDASTVFHERMIAAEVRQGLKQFPAAPETFAYVDQLKRDLVVLYARHGATHFQIGRAYPYLPRLDPQARALVEALKSSLDPKNLMNPGALGFAPALPREQAGPQT